MVVIMSGGPASTTISISWTSGSDKRRANNLITCFPALFWGIKESGDRK